MTLVQNMPCGLGLSVIFIKNSIPIMLVVCVSIHSLISEEADPVCYQRLSPFSLITEEADPVCYQSFSQLSYL